MITKMLKYTFLVYHQQYNEFLEKLRSVGVLHIDELQEGIAENDKVRNQLQLVARIDKQIAEASKLIPEGSDILPVAQYDETKLLGQLDEQKNAIAGINQQIASLQREAKRVEPWGVYDSAKWSQLREAGYVIQFFQCPVAKYQSEWEQQYNAVKLALDGKLLRFITVNHSEISIEDAEQVSLNEKNANQIAQQISQLTEQRNRLQEELVSWAIANVNNLEDLKARVLQDTNWDRAQLSTLSVADEKVKLLVGFCPEEKIEELNHMLDAEGIYYQTAQPTEEDKTPIKLKNNKFTQMFEVLTGMYGWPVYGEFDPTPVLAPFFLLFFALCMGDGGYGILLIIFGLLTYYKKINISMFEGLGPIITTLGVGTLIVGLLLGTAFGVNLYEVSWVPDWCKHCMIRGEVAGYDIQMVMALCIGVFHICLAMTIKAVIYTKRFGLKANISTWAWLLLILGSLIVGILALTEIFTPDAAKWALIIIGSVSALGIYIFNTPGRNPLINVGAGLWDTYNMATGILGDVLSYIRLYALGLAGGMLGAAFNNLGLMVLGDNPNIGKWIGFVLILIVGHLLNLCMSALGAFVHPLRLSFVEFFKNSGYEGKGQRYRPFADELSATKQ